MYEKLIKSLRACAESNTTRVCLTCPWSLHQKGCISAMVTAAADALEELEEKAQALAETLYAYEHPWIPVTERLPEEDVAVLTWGEQAVVLIDWHRNGKWFVADGVTHWMPLPQPPTDCRQTVTDSNQLINEPVNKPYKLEEET